MKILFLFLLISSSVYGQTFISSNKELVAKYASDTTHMAKIQNRTLLPFLSSFDEEVIGDKIQNTINKKRAKYPQKRIKNIKEAVEWMEKVHYRANPDPERTINPNFSYYLLTHYKEVENGFLIRVKYDAVTGDLLPSKCQKRYEYYALFLIGYDHNVLMVNHWEIDICPQKYSTVINPEDITYTTVDDSQKEIIPPILNITGKDFFTYLQENVKYPQKVIRQGIQGRLSISFVVGREGKVSEIEINRGLDPLTDKPVVQLVENTDGYWTPGVIDNELIITKIKFCITFKIEDNLSDR